MYKYRPILILLFYKDGIIYKYYSLGWNLCENFYYTERKDDESDLFAMSSFPCNRRVIVCPRMLNKLEHKSLNFFPVFHFYITIESNFHNENLYV